MTAAFVLNLHDRLANLAAPATDDLGLSLDERRLPKRIRRKQLIPARISRRPAQPEPKS
jgi:hypothetical protein